MAPKGNSLGGIPSRGEADRGALAGLPLAGIFPRPQRPSSRMAVVLYASRVEVPQLSRVNGVTVAKDVICYGRKIEFGVLIRREVRQQLASGICYGRPRARLIVIA